MEPSVGDPGEASARERAGIIDSAGWGVLFVWVGFVWMAGHGWGNRLLGSRRPCAQRRT